MQVTKFRVAPGYQAPVSLDTPAFETCSKPASSSLRQTLRAATSAIHSRLHRHTGFAALQHGTINLVDYRALLVRLYGFHVSFEAALGIASDRSAWLQDDLTAVGLGGHALATIPRCPSLTAFPTQAGRLGALYVVEGSTLGGRHLARALNPLLGNDESVGRRFFLGRGAKTDTAWNEFLLQLTLAAGTPDGHRETVDAAVTTFGVFEEWLHGWREFPE